MIFSGEVHPWRYVTVYIAVLFLYLALYLYLGQICVTRTLQFIAFFGCIYRTLGYRSLLSKIEWETPHDPDIILDSPCLRYGLIFSRRSRHSVTTLCHSMSTGICSRGSRGSLEQMVYSLSSLSSKLLLPLGFG